MISFAQMESEPTDVTDLLLQILDELKVISKELGAFGRLADEWLSPEQRGITGWAIRRRTTSGRS